MHQFRFLQYNTDNMRLGSDYFDQLLTQCDIALLQRVPKAQLSVLQQQFDHVHCARHSSDLYLVVAGKDLLHTPVIQQLPSTDTVMAGSDIFQGCCALRVTWHNIVLVSALPCYSDPDTDIGSLLNTQDVQALLSYDVDKPTLIAADFHEPPNHQPHQQLLSKYQYHSCLDNHTTFRNSNGHSINLDRCVTNSHNIQIHDICIHRTDLLQRQGHYAVTYSVQLNKTGLD
jgi:hypothetical protein